MVSEALFLCESLYHFMRKTDVVHPRTNRDLDPVPPHARKWGVTSFIAYWISDAFNAATWQFGAGVIAVGLTWRESVGIVALSFFIISIVVSITNGKNDGFNR